MSRGKSQGYHRVSRPRKFVEFYHPDLGTVTDVSPRAALILLNLNTDHACKFNNLLIDVPEGDTVVYEGIEFKIVPHNYRHK